MQDARFIRRCFELAQLGAGSVSPNPLVGAVLVHEGRIIGEGWHQKYGAPHAEVNCLRSVLPENQALIPNSTLYCNLEPCSHFGKTPPCADLILAHKIPRVVVSNTDPNPLVAGKGLAKLRQAGVQVAEGVLEMEGQWLNRIFFTWIIQKRPYILLKWAQSQDGFIGKNGERCAISCPPALRLTHRWRSEVDAMLIGTKTAVLDNPRLDTRFYFGKKPLRIALDQNGRIPATHHLFDGSQETWILGPARYLEPAGSEEIQFFKTDPGFSIPVLLDLLKDANHASLLVEGGAHLLHQFLEAGLWDEIRVLENTRPLGEGIHAPSIPTEAVLKDQILIGQDVVRIFAR